jgi:hypothetical protein
MGLHYFNKSESVQKLLGNKYYTPYEDIKHRHDPMNMLVQFITRKAS